MSRNELDLLNHSDVKDALERAGIDPDRLRSWLAGLFLRTRLPMLA